MLSSILLCGYITSYLSIYLLMDILAVSIHTEVFIWTCSPNNSFSLGQVPRNGMARSYDRCMFNLLRNCQTFPRWSYHLIPPPAMCEIPFPMLGMVSLFSFGHSNRCRASFHVFIAIHIFFG